METILLTKTDPDIQYKTTILSWSPEFTEIILDRLGMYGWKSRLNENLFYLDAPSDWEIRVYKSIDPFIFNNEFYIPRYEFFFYGTLICGVSVQIGRYSTLYETFWYEQNLVRLEDWLHKETLILLGLPTPFRISLNDYLIGEKNEKI